MKSKQIERKIEKGETIPQVINLYAWFNAIYILYALDIYIRWLINNYVLYIIFVLVSLTFLFNKKIQFIFKISNNISTVIILVIYILFITMPLFEGYSMRFGHIMYFIPLIPLVILNDRILQLTYDRFDKIIFFFISVGLVIYVLVHIGVSVPYFEFQRGESRYYWRIYYLAVSLYDGGFALQTTYFERFCGPFGEPGNAAIFLAILIIINNYNFNERKNIVYFIAGVLTLSPVFFFLIFIGFSFRMIDASKMTKKNLLAITIVIVLVSITLSNSKYGETIRSVVFERTMTGGIITSIENRVPDQFWGIYQDFHKNGNIWVGNGYDSLEDIPSTPNYRTFIYRFGYIGIGICVILSLSLVKNNRPQKILLWIIIFLSVLSHRYWMFLIPGIYGVFLISIAKSRINNSK